MSENISELIELLRKMEAVNAEIQGSAIVSVQGLPICSTCASRLGQSASQWNNPDSPGKPGAKRCSSFRYSQRAVSKRSYGLIRDKLPHRHKGNFWLLAWVSMAGILEATTPASYRWFGQIGLHLGQISKRACCLEGLFARVSVLLFRGIFFKGLLLFFFGMDMKGPRCHLTPSLSFEEAIHGTFMDLVSQVLL